MNPGEHDMGVTDRMPVHIIVAMTEDGVIGTGNALPWHIPEELRLFRELTVGTTVIMGRHTFEAIGRPLPDRNNIVVSTTMTPREGIQIARSLDEALRLGRTLHKHIFIIGGATLYQAALGLADYLHVSIIHGHYDGDVTFPPHDPADWHLDATESFDRFTYYSYSRIQK